MTTTQRRQVVTHRRAAFDCSARRACRLVGLARSRWQATLERPLRDAPVRERLRALAAARPRFGYERLHLLLRRAGLVIHHTRVLRLYREERLAVRVRRRQKPAAVARVPLPPVTAANERWGMDFIHDRCADMDFIHDRCADQTMLRCLTMVDACTRECPAIEAGRSLPAARVITTLETLAAARGGYPRSLVVDHGPEFVSRGIGTGGLRLAAHAAGAVGIPAIVPRGDLPFVGDVNQDPRQDCSEAEQVSDHGRSPRTTTPY